MKPGSPPMLSADAVDQVRREWQEPQVVRARGISPGACSGELAA